MTSRTKRLKIDDILTSRTKYSNQDEKDNKKKEKRNSYISFVIKMLEDPQYNKKTKINKGQINMIKSISFKKTKSKSKPNYKSLETNNTQRINNNLNNPKKNLNNINSIKNNISCRFKKNIKLNNSYRNNKLNLNNYNKTDYNSLKINSYMSKNNKNEKSMEEIKKGKNKNNKEKENKSTKNKKKNILNKLYGYNTNYIFSKSKILKKKNLFELDNYQNNILKISQRKLSRDNLIRLYTELQTIKTDAEMIKPLPPINYPALVVHSFKEVDDREKHKPIISYENKKLKDMDEYEKELFIIKKSNKFKKAKNVRNKRLYKIFEILPEHVVDVVFKNKNKII